MTQTGLTPVTYVFVPLGDAFNRLNRVMGAFEAQIFMASMIPAQPIGGVVTRLYQQVSPFVLLDHRSYTFLTRKHHEDYIN